MGVIATAVRHMLAGGMTPEQILEAVQDIEDQIALTTKLQATSLIASLLENRIINAEKPQENQEVIQENGVKERKEPKERNIYITNNSGKGEGVRGRGKPISGTADRDFDAFWLAFPRRIGKGAARRAWAKASILATIPEIMAGVERYASVCKTKEKEFICHPSTWLNQERWTDEYSNENKDLRNPPKRTWAEIKAERAQNALVRGDDEIPEGRTGPEEPKLAGVRDFLPPLQPVDYTQENQAALCAEALSDEVSVCWDDEWPPEAIGIQH